MMQIAIITAMSTNRVIGINNQLPWHLPADLKHFKNLTLGKPIIMGRKTFESIGKPLPGRENIVVTHHLDLTIPGCKITHSLEQAISCSQGAGEIMIIGGAKIFEQALPIANRLYLTLIHHHFEGDTFFPQWQVEDWQEQTRQDFLPDEKNHYPYSFLFLERKQGTLKR